MVTSVPGERSEPCQMARPASIVACQSINSCCVSRLSDRANGQDHHEGRNLPGRPIALSAAGIERRLADLSQISRCLFSGPASLWPRQPQAERCVAWPARCGFEAKVSIEVSLHRAGRGMHFAVGGSCMPFRHSPPADDARQADGPWTRKSRSTRVPSRLVSSTTGPVRLSDEWRSPLRGEKRGNP